ncbi:MAG: phage portal protein [Micromonosporaceae bacterium]|nr:phage portal protein [Micromonosporaceae bacterium]
MSSDEDMLHRLIRLHDQQLRLLRELDAYYEGTQPLSYMHPELLLQLEGQVRQVVVAWPQLVVDSVEERLNIEGFRRPAQASGDDRLWEIWQANDLDEGSQRAHVEALVMGRSYVTVGAADTADDPPVITDESALDVIATVDPRTRRTAAALRRWSSQDADSPASEADRATLYLPDATIVFAKGDDGTWVEDSRDQHDLGAVPVVPILHRARRKRPFGVSELAGCLPLSDAACKIATDMMVGANYHALTRYWATGVSESDFTDEQGNPVSVWQTVTGRIWSTENEQAKLGAFPSSDLSNFHNTLKALAQLVSSIYGLPPHYLGFSTDNPASAEGLKSSEARLNLRAERKQVMFGGGWEQVMRLAVRIQTRVWDPVLRRLETDWRDPSTPTIAQAADAAVKTYQAGIVPLRQTRRRLRFSDAEIRQMEEDDAAAREADPVGVLSRAIGQGALAS